MSDPDGGSARSQGSDLRRFLVVVAAGALVLVVVFLLIRAGQQSNSERNYQDCLDAARSSQSDDTSGFRPEDSCQKPD